MIGEFLDARARVGQRWGVVLLVLMVSYFPSFGQGKVHIESIDTEKYPAEIYYTLEHAEPEAQFRITPYYVDSLGNQHRMHEVSGDVGSGVTAGNHKLIEWKFLRDLGPSGGSIMRIALELAPMPSTAALSLARKKYRRTGKIIVPPEQSPGARYELLDSDREVVTEGTWNKNPKGYYLRLPRSLPIAENYQLRTWNEQGQPIYSSPFAIQRNIPLFAQVGGAALAAGTILYFLLHDANEELPDPNPLPSR